MTPRSPFNVPRICFLERVKNRDRPHFSRRENPVEIRLPRERVMLGDIPDWTDRSFFPRRTSSHSNSWYSGAYPT